MLETLNTFIVDEQVPACMDFLHRNTSLRHLTLYAHVKISREWNFSAMHLEYLKLVMARTITRLFLPPTLRTLEFPCAISSPYGYDGIVVIDPQNLSLQVFNREGFRMLKRNRIRNVTLEALAQYEPEYVRKEWRSIFRA